jgi:NAD(P)-dependent dehydrogenase (short-subunit alcohol dehydrogenase family)
MKTWFITGSSKGFGHIWAEAALARGDKVAATARDTDTLKDLVDKYGEAVLPIQLDVTDKSADEAAVKHAYDTFGRLDVVINNAGYGLFGAIEEVSEAQARAQLETNFFGALWITQAALPYMRKQKSGHIIQVSSIGGVNAFPTIGLYHASKWALEGMTQSLAAEVKDFGIKVTLVEPTGYSTDWSTTSADHAEAIADYDSVKAKQTESFKERRSNPGKPEATGQAILQLVDMEQPPLRIFFGKGTNEMIHQEYDSRLAEWDTHRALSDAAHG